MRGFRSVLGLALFTMTGVFVACGADGPTVDESAGDVTTAIPSGNPNGKNDGAECVKGFDCKSGVCSGDKCAVPASNDKVRNGDETGLDCGGPNAPPCGGGQACNVGADCANGECKEGKCSGPASGPVAPTATDGKKDGDESDVDCGGKETGAPPCGTDKGCNTNDDCESKVCSAGKKCQAASATDETQNGDETDVDCGGTTTNAPRCDVGRKCVKHEDCQSDGCGEDKKCALGRSCTQIAGGQSCGTGEHNDPNKKHESCCVSLPIPGSATKLDKYKVTAGRMRAFIDRVNGDVRGWYNANKASLNAKQRAQLDPYVGGFNVGGQSFTYLPTNANEAALHLGGFIFLEDRPSTVQGCFVGTANEQANGSHTYWNDIEGDDRPFDKTFLDRLTLNCVPFPILAAFCAWDGGRVQTWEENNQAYGAGKYPWGNAPEAGGFYVFGNGNGQVVGPAAPGNATSCPGCNPGLLNWASNYQFPEGGSATKPWDYSYFISAPGRFDFDTGAGGHKDLGGVMMELTASPGAFNQPPTSPNGVDVKYGKTIRWSRAGSFEGHGANNTQWQFAVMTKYGKQGGRCARD